MSEDSIVEGPALNVVDLKDKFLPLLSENTKNSIGNKVEKGEGDDYKVVYHSLTYRSDKDRDAAMEILSKEIEEISSAYGLKGHIMICGGLELKIVDLSLPKAVFSFVAIPKSSYDDYVARFMNRENGTAVHPGGIGPNIERLLEKSSERG